MKGDLTETETESNEALSEWEEERQKSRANELRSRSLLGPSERRSCGWLVKAQATRRLDVPTDPGECCGCF